MKANKLVLIIALAASAVTAGYATTQQPSYDDALPAAEGAPIPQIVIVAKRSHVAE